MSIVRRPFLYSSVMVASLLGAAFVIVWIGLRNSLPKIDGQMTLAGLDAQLIIDRDAAGVPTIRSIGRNDLARGLGYVHAQDRYFQMDLLRRAAAGELSALLGPPLLPTDKTLRLHAFRKTARAVVAGLDSPTRALLDAYVSGVNAGLNSLRSRPFEYWLLRVTPKPWSSEDSILCIFAMYLQLQDSTGHTQLQRALLRAILPEAAWQFVEAGAPEWDAAIDGSNGVEPTVPRADQYNLRSFGRATMAPPEQALQGQPSVHMSIVGSNNWAVAGSRTASGAGIVANDMHLNFRVPNIWYRARLVQSGKGGINLTGITLPGTPAAVAGSNGFIAWGFTNSYGDFSQVIRLVPVRNDPTLYQTATGPRALRGVEERIEVAHSAAVVLKTSMTQWGPVMGKDWDGVPYALLWTAHDSIATNLNLIGLETVRSADEAIRVATGFGIPGQNFIVADSGGNIGWTLAGRLPKRAYPGKSSAQVSTAVSLGFAGLLAPEDHPRVVNPPAGILWSANARVVGGAAAALIGDDGMDRGSRAKIIHSHLLKTEQPFTTQSSLAIQLDDGADFLNRWRLLLIDTLDNARKAGLGAHQNALETLKTWSGHATPDDAAYRLVNVFREQVAARAFYMLVGPAQMRYPNFKFEIPSSFEGPLWRLMQQRPMHLLAARYQNWDAFLLEALIASESLPPGCTSLLTCSWGRVNAVHIAHPLSRAIPLIAPLLDMPTVQIPGGTEDMPRIQGRDFGASERFSVSPGHEAEGYFHMPGGQSGHPLSPFYRAGFADWAAGRPSAFLPGSRAHRLVLSKP